MNARARSRPRPPQLANRAAGVFAVLAAGLVLAGCGSGVASSLKSLAPSKSISVPSASPAPVPTTRPSVATPTAAPSVTTPTAIQSPSVPVAQPSASPTPAHVSRPVPAWLWWLVGAVVVIGLIVVVIVIRSVRASRLTAVGAWRSRTVDAYAKGSALYDAMSAAELPGPLAGADSAARWADIQRRADGLAQTLYSMRETAPDEDQRARVVDTLGALQAVRSAMAAERTPGAGPEQAEVVRGRLFGFDAALRALRPPDPPLR